VLVFHNDSRGHRESCRIGAESRGERKSRIIRLERNVLFVNRVGCIACDVLLFLTVRTSKRVHSGRSGADETEAFLRNAAPRRVASRRVSLIERAVSSERVTGRSAMPLSDSAAAHSIRFEATRRKRKSEKAKEGGQSRTHEIGFSVARNEPQISRPTRWSCRAGLAGRHIDSLLCDTISRTRVTRVNWRNLIAHAVAS